MTTVLLYIEMLVTFTILIIVIFFGLIKIKLI